MLPYIPLPIDMKRKREEDTEIYFKAYQNGEFRKLSNLFGQVEWKFQLEKFEPSSEVAEYIRTMMVYPWTAEEFKLMLKQLKHTGKVESYIHADGEIATGLIPKLLAVIAKSENESVDLARTRLAVVLGKKSITVAELEDWRRVNVRKEISDNDKDALLRVLLVEKFSIPMYRELLLKTKDAILHEAKGRMAPNRYEWQKKELSDEEKAKGYWQGGDALGKLLMSVREEIVNA